MPKIVMWVLLLGVFIITAGCGQSELNSNQSKNTNGNSQGGQEQSAQVIASISQEHPMVFQYKLENQTNDDITLNFTTSQRFDYSVHTESGKQLYLFSSAATFMQVLGEETIKQGETLEYAIDIKDLNLRQGDYILTVWMTPKDGKKYESKYEFSVLE